MKDVSTNDGRTVLFVSHDMQAVSTLTATSIYLKNGTIFSIGPTRKVIHEYMEATKARDNIYLSTKPASVPHIKRVEIKTSLANNVHECTAPLELEFIVNAPFPIKDVCFSFQIIDSKGRNYVHQWIFDYDTPYCRESGQYKLTCVIPAIKLYMGKYYLRCYLSEAPGGAVFEVLEDICPFEMVMYKVTRNKFQWSPDACAYLEDANWSVKKEI